MMLTLRPFEVGQKKSSIGRCLARLAEAAFFGDAVLLRGARRLLVFLEEGMAVLGLAFRQYGALAKLRETGNLKERMGGASALYGIGPAGRSSPMGKPRPCLHHLNGAPLSGHRGKQLPSMTWRCAALLVWVSRLFPFRFPLPSCLPLLRGFAGGLLSGHLAHG